jgi:hypothetical protein
MRKSEYEPAGTFRRDFRVFGDPGLLVSLVLLALMVGIVAGALLYGNVNYGISPF